MYGALYRRYPAAGREGAVFDQCALDVLFAGDRGLDRGHYPVLSVALDHHRRHRSVVPVGRGGGGDRGAVLDREVLVHRWTTETDVTNMRVVHKTGFIKRRTFEMSLDKVESVDVNQTILGRLLNYGSVTVRGVGEGSETIETIASPLDFRNHITAR